MRGYPPRPVPHDRKAAPAQEANADEPRQRPVAVAPGRARPTRRRRSRRLQVARRHHGRRGAARVARPEPALIPRTRVRRRRRSKAVGNARLGTRHRRVPSASRTESQARNRRGIEGGRSTPRQPRRVLRGVGWLVNRSVAQASLGDALEAGRRAQVSHTDEHSPLVGRNRPAGQENRAGLAWG